MGFFNYLWIPTLEPFVEKEGPAHCWSFWSCVANVSPELWGFVTPRAWRPSQRGGGFRLFCLVRCRLMTNSEEARCGCFGEVYVTPRF
jgi:hypothetical protein